MASRLTKPVRALALLACAPLWSEANAQTESAPAAVKRIAEAYRDGPLADRVSLSVGNGDHAGGAAEIIVHIDPDGAVLLEMGALTLWAGEEMVEGVVESNRGAYFAAPRAGRPIHHVLWRHLPWTPLPQPGLAFDSAPQAPDVLPFAGPFSWETGQVDDDGSLFAAHGESPQAAVTLIADVETARLRRAAVMRRGDARTDRLRVEPIDPGDPSQWRPDTSGRRAVSTLADLALIEPEIDPGDPAPEILLLTLDGRPWRLSEAAGDPAALLLFRADTPGAGAGREALERLAERHPTLVARWAVVLDQRDRSLFQRRDALAEEWGPELLWTVAHESTIDPFAPNSGAAILLVDAAGVVQGALPLDDRAGDVDELTEETGRLLDL